MRAIHCDGYLSSSLFVIRAIRHEGYSLKGLFGRFGRLLNKKFFLQVAAGLHNHVNSYGIGFNFSY